MKKKRFYRALMKREGLVSFEVRHKETDLYILAKSKCEAQVSAWILEARSAIEEYALAHPGFIEAHHPLELDPFAPEVVKKMLEAGKKANVGPMAAVAGVIADYVARKIVAFQKDGEVIVENGGDIVFFAESPIVFSVFSANSPFFGKIGIKLNILHEFISVCTSSGTIGHSKSFGKADAVTVISKDAAFADALATSVGNKVMTKRDIDGAIEILKNSEGVLGGIIIKDDAIGLFGAVELVAL